MNIRVEEYVQEDGSNPFKAWFDGLDAQATAKVASAVMRPSAGNTSRVKWLGGIGECRIDWEPGYRADVAPDGERFILFRRGGTKRHQQADIACAKGMHAEYKARKALPPRFLTDHTTR